MENLTASQIETIKKLGEFYTLVDPVKIIEFIKEDKRIEEILVGTAQKISERFDQSEIDKITLELLEDWESEELTKLTVCIFTTTDWDLAYEKLTAFELEIWYGFVGDLTKIILDIKSSTFSEEFRTSRQYNHTNIEPQGSIKNQKDIIDEIQQILIGDWDAAQDWGEDPFTEVMTEEIAPELKQQRRKTFEATCYYVAQELMYSHGGKEILEKVIAARGDMGQSGIPEPEV